MRTAIYSAVAIPESDTAHHHATAYTIPFAKMSTSGTFKLSEFHFELDSALNNANVRSTVKIYLTANRLRTTLDNLKLEVNGKLRALLEMLVKDWRNAATVINQKAQEFCGRPVAPQSLGIDVSCAGMIDSVAWMAKHTVLGYLTATKRQWAHRELLDHVYIVISMVIQAVFELYERRDGPFSRALLSDAIRKSARELELEEKVRELSEEKAIVEREMAALTVKHEQEMREKDTELDKKTKEAAALRSQLKIVNARSAGKTGKGTT